MPDEPSPVDDDGDPEDDSEIDLIGHPPRPNDSIALTKPWRKWNHHKYITEPPTCLSFRILGNTLCPVGFGQGKGAEGSTKDKWLANIEQSKGKSQCRTKWLFPLLFLEQGLGVCEGIGTLWSALRVVVDCNLIYYVRGLTCPDEQWRLIQSCFIFLLSGCANIISTVDAVPTLLPILQCANGKYSSLVIWIVLNSSTFVRTALCLKIFALHRRRLVNLHR